MSGNVTAKDPAKAKQGGVKLCEAERSNAFSFQHPYLPELRLSLIIQPSNISMSQDISSSTKTFEINSLFKVDYNSNVSIAEVNQGIICMQFLCVFNAI